MKRTTMVLVFVLALAVWALPASASQGRDLAPLHRASGEAVEGQYIVVMEDGALPEEAAADVGAEPLHTYEHALTGFSAKLTRGQLEAVRRNPRVEFVEEDQVATLEDQRPVTERTRREPEASTKDVQPQACQSQPPWGLDRIDQRSALLDNSYCWNTDAPGVDIYVVDTGIQWDHPDLAKVLSGYDAFGGNSYDCHGHGTHVAGTATSQEYGVSKNSWLWSVRVLDCGGFGSTSTIIDGTDWVRGNVADWPGYPAVANYSLSTPTSTAVNNAVNALSNAGVFVAVAAGNQDTLACNRSPASASSVTTVAASNRWDERASFSNYGSCVDLYAPGVDITSTWVGGGTRTISGTSMASPHVAGVGALYKATHGDHHYSTVRSWITSWATSGVITGNPSGTPNLLLYKSNL